MGIAGTRSSGSTGPVKNFAPGDRPAKSFSCAPSFEGASGDGEVAVGMAAGDAVGVAISLAVDVAVDAASTPMSSAPKSCPKVELGSAFAGSTPGTEGAGAWDASALEMDTATMQFARPMTCMRGARSVRRPTNAQPLASARKKER